MFLLSSDDRVHTLLLYSLIIMSYSNHQKCVFSKLPYLSDYFRIRHLFTEFLDNKVAFWCDIINIKEGLFLEAFLFYLFIHLCLKLEIGMLRN